MRLGPYHAIHALMLTDLPAKFRLLQLIDFPHTAEFAPLFVDPTELAAIVLQDRRAIADLKETRQQSNQEYR